MSAGRIRFDKLIRDRIPENLDAKGVAHETRVLDEDEFEQELLKKVSEEAAEFVTAADRAELVKELADLEDVLTEVKMLKNITEAELQAAKEVAQAKKGGFTKRLFLLWSADDGYKTP